MGAPPRPASGRPNRSDWNLKMKRACAIPIILGMFAGSLAAADQPPAPRQGRAMAAGSKGPVYATVISGTVISSPIVSADPDSGVVNATIQASWTVSGGSLLWIMYVHTDPTAPNACPNMPASAVQLTCQSVNPRGAGTCLNKTITLSGTAQSVAYALFPSAPGPYSVTFALTFTDSWRYPATGAGTCSLGLAFDLFSI